MPKIESRDILVLSEKLKNIEQDLAIFKEYMIHVPIDDIILSKLFGLMTESAVLCRYRLRNIAFEHTESSEDLLNRIYKTT